jgi:hypothetical protein
MFLVHNGISSACFGQFWAVIREKRIEIEEGIMCNNYNIYKLNAFCWGTRWRSWLRHYATSRRVAVSIPDCVTGIFHGHNPSGRTMALGSTQPLTEVTGILPGGKGGRCVGLTTLLPSCADCLQFWEPQPPGTLRACPGL